LINPNLEIVFIYLKSLKSIRRLQNKSQFKVNLVPRELVLFLRQIKSSQSLTFLRVFMEHQFLREQTNNHSENDRHYHSAEPAKFAHLVVAASNVECNRLREAVNFLQKLLHYF
jgi:hypothetical protein